MRQGRPNILVRDVSTNPTAPRAVLGNPQPHWQGNTPELISRAYFGLRRVIASVLIRFIMGCRQRDLGL